MSKMIALIDGSVYSDSVCDHAAWLAGRTGGAVEVLHVMGRRIGATGAGNMSGSIGLGARSKLLEELSELDAQQAKMDQRVGRVLLDGAKDRLEAAGVENVTERLRTGDLLEAVTQVEDDAEVLVIGKRGESADFAKLHLGSNLERIARAAKKPVLVAARAFTEVRSVLVAFDGGASAMRAVEYMALSPVFKDLDVTLLSVTADASKVTADLKAATQMLARNGITAQTEIREGQPDAVISAAVAGEGEAEGHQLLVMGAYGHSRIRSLIIGSTTSEMIRSCLVPVMLFR